MRHSTSPRNNIISGKICRSTTHYKNGRSTAFSTDDYILVDVFFCDTRPAKRRGTAIWGCEIDMSLYKTTTMFLVPRSAITLYLYHIYFVFFTK